MKHTLKDFSRRMREVLEELSEAESRSQLEVLRDLTTISSDLIRLRSASRETEHGSIPIEASVTYLESVHDALLAAACSAIKRKAQYPTKKPTEAVEYLKKVRLGQTEQGSFVLSILCPIPPELSPSATILPVEPFGRRVTKTFMTALNAVQSASRHAVESGDFQPFKDAIEMGVSANFCDALVSIGEATPDTPIDISVSWSRNRLASDVPSSRIYLEPEVVPVIKEAARIFRETEPERGYEVVGFVVQLKRAEHEQIGHVVIAAINDGQLKRVLVDLPEDLYAIALQANDRRAIVTCTGDLVRHGRSFKLSNARNFQVLAEQQDRTFDIFGFAEDE